MLLKEIFLIEDFKEDLINSLKEKYPQNLKDIDKLIASKLNPKFFEHILNIKGTEPIEDVIPTIKTFIQFKDALKSRNLDVVLFNYKSVNDIRETLNSFQTKKEKKEEIKNINSTNIYESDKWLVVMPHTVAASCFYGKDTTWCTTTTKGPNMFLNYVAQSNENVALYYLINKHSNPRIDPNAKFGIGAINGKLLIDKREDGTLTVNSKNKGLNKNDIEEILGDEYSTIINLLSIHAEQLKNKHPAKKEVKEVATNYNKYKTYTKDMTEEVKDEFDKIVIGYPEINKDIAREITSQIVPNSNYYYLLLELIEYNKKDSFENILYYHPNFKVLLQQTFQLLNQENKQFWWNMVVNKYKNMFEGKDPKIILDYFEKNQVPDLLDKLLPTIAPEDTTKLINTLQENSENENLHNYSVQRNLRYFSKYVGIDNLPFDFEINNEGKYTIFISRNQYDNLKKMFDWFHRKFPYINYISDLNGSMLVYDDQYAYEENIDYNEVAEDLKERWFNSSLLNYGDFQSLPEEKQKEIMDTIYNFFVEDKLFIADRFGIIPRVCFRWQKGDF